MHHRVRVRHDGGEMPQAGSYVQLVALRASKGRPLLFMAMLLANDWVYYLLILTLWSYDPSRKS